MSPDVNSGVGAAVAIPLTPSEALAYEITDPSALTPTALAYVRARNADPMCKFIILFHECGI
jgi:phosphoribosylaminoimidazolecarboxamide formyltransferase/IMP cyclohydrolase